MMLLLFFDVVAMALFVPIYLALYAALRQAGKAFMAIAAAFGLVGIAVYLASNPAFSMLSLSSQYAAATTEVQRSLFMAAGQAMLALYHGTALQVSYAIFSLAGLIISAVMLRSTIFSKATTSLAVLCDSLPPYGSFRPGNALTWLS